MKQSAPICGSEHDHSPTYLDSFGKSSRCKHEKGCVEEFLVQGARSFFLGYFLQIIRELLSLTREGSEGISGLLKNARPTSIPLFLFSMNSSVRILNCLLKRTRIPEEIIHFVSGCKVYLII